MPVIDDTRRPPNRGADLQYWSERLHWTAEGDPLPLRLVDQWTRSHE